MRDDRIIFENSLLHKADEPQEHALTFTADQRPKEITLTCHTPLRLKYNNQLQDGLPFHIVIRAALRRISSLETASTAMVSRSLIAAAWLPSLQACCKHLPIVVGPTSSAIAAGKPTTFGLGRLRVEPPV